MIEIQISLLLLFDSFLFLTIKPIQPSKDHSKPALRPFWQGSAVQDSAGIYHSRYRHKGFNTVCVCVFERETEWEQERDDEREEEGRYKRECMWQPWLSWLGERERDWNRFIPRLVALHAYTHTHTHNLSLALLLSVSACRVFICLSSTVLGALHCLFILAAGCPPMEDTFCSLSSNFGIIRCQNWSSWICFFKI